MVGYSAPDEFFGECWSGIGVLMTESIAGLLMNSFTLTLLYQVSASSAWTIVFVVGVSPLLLFENTCVCFCCVRSIFWSPFHDLSLRAQRLSRGQRRSNTVVFSEKACVVVRGGRLFFEARVCDLTPGASLIGATVRVFAVRDEVDHRRNTSVVSSLCAASTLPAVRVSIFLYLLLMDACGEE